MNDTRFLNEALTYARCGWTIIPVRHRPGTGGKQPAVAWREYQHRKPTEAELRGWFGNGQPMDGLAVVLGAASGRLCCRDFDAMDGYRAWAAAHPDLAEQLPTVATARGRHVYIRSKWTGFVDLGDGELRGDAGHYAMLPPSKHPSGHVYRWLIPWPDRAPPELDPYQAGFLPVSVTERQRDGENRETEKQSMAQSLCFTSPAVEAAIAGTLPGQTGQRNAAVFSLARALKALPDFADAAAADLRDIVRRWHDRALRVIGTKDFDSTWADFVAAWPRVRFPAGQDPMAVILDRANGSPLPAAAERYDAPETRRLVAVCHQLQRLSGDRPFFLSCRTAARLVGLDMVSAWRRLGMLVADGVLRVVQEGTHCRATRYRYTDEDTTCESVSTNV